MNWLASGSWKPWVRRGLAVACGVGAILCIRQYAAGVMLAIPLGILGALLALPELTFPFTWLIDVWLGTGAPPGQRPPLDLRLAQHYVRAERWEDACAEYERILGFYPGVEEPYEELFRLGARLGRTEREMQRLYRKAQRRIRDREARSRLFRAFEEARELIRGRDAA